jgi:hypothetical protein
VASVESVKTVPCVRGGARGGGLAVGVGEALQRRRGDEHGHRDPRADDRRRRIDRAHVDEHPRAQPVAGEGVDVVAQRSLVARTAGVVAEHAGLEHLRRAALEVVHVDQAVHGPGPYRRAPGARPLPFRR